MGDDGGNQCRRGLCHLRQVGGFGTIDLTGLAPADGFIIQGDAAYDSAGFSVASAGDVNGDGYDDLIVGAPVWRRWRHPLPARPMSSSARPAAFGTIDLTGLAPADGFIIQGDYDGDRAGWSVASAGDVNGDGYDDLIVGAPRGDDGGINAGEAYVIFGKSAGVRHDRPYRASPRPTASSSRAMPPTTAPGTASRRPATSMVTAMTT